MWVLKVSYVQKQLLSLKSNILSIPNSICISIKVFIAFSNHTVVYYNTKRQQAMGKMSPFYYLSYKKLHFEIILKLGIGSILINQIYLKKPGRRNILIEALRSLFYSNSNSQNLIRLNHCTIKYYSLKDSQMSTHYISLKRRKKMKYKNYSFHLITNFLNLNVKRHFTQKNI